MKTAGGYNAERGAMVGAYWFEPNRRTEADVIKKLKSGKYQLHTKDGSRVLGPPTSKAKALQQERAIQAAKRRRAK